MTERPIPPRTAGEPVGIDPERRPPDVPGSAERRARNRVWAGVALLAALGVCSRLAYLAWAVGQPGFEWTDPDLYLAKVVALDDGPGWNWSVKATEYRHLGRLFHLPPLYSMYLSAAALLPGSIAGAAAIGHAVLFGARVVAAYALGANLHSRRAGVVAAVMMVLAPHSLHITPIFLQEQLYIPLLLTAFAVFTWLLAGGRGAGWWAIGGAVFGLAILTRSMLVYYLPLAIAGVIWSAGHRPTAMRQAGWLALGVAVVTLTYSLWLSADVGRWIFVENHGSISMTAYTGVIRTAPPSPLQEGAALVSAFVERPVGFLRRFVEFLRSNFRPSAHRWLELHLPPLTGTPRAVAEAYAHVMTNAGFALAVLLAPFGVVLARRRLPSFVLALWPPVVMVLTALSAYGGPRYRMPFEVVLNVYLAIVLARQWRRPSRREIGLASLVSAAALPLVW
jgi:4-amino-4-deoxy-L-arabinose transferase-like glycosyltransferase